MTRPRDLPKPAGWWPKGLYPAHVNNANGDGLGHPTVDIAELGITNCPTHGNLIDFDPSTGSGGSPSHSHSLTGPIFNPGDLVLVAFLAGDQHRPVVLGRFG